MDGKFIGLGNEINVLRHNASCGFSFNFDIVLARSLTHSLTHSLTLNNNLLDSLTHSLIITI